MCDSNGLVTSDLVKISAIEKHEEIQHLPFLFFGSDSQKKKENLHFALVKSFEPQPVKFNWGSLIILTPAE